VSRRTAVFRRAVVRRRHAPHLVTQQAITTPFISSEEAVYSPAVGTGPVSVTVPLIGSDEQVYTPAVAPGAVSIAPTFIGSAEQVYDPVLNIGLTIAPSLIPSEEQIYAPTITTGPVTITTPLVGSAEQVYTPALSMTVTTTLIGSAEQVYSPTLTVGPVSVTVALIASAEQVYSPALGLNVVVPHVPSGGQVYAPSLKLNVVVPLVPTAEQVYSPTLQPGPVSIAVVFIASAEQVFDPTVTTTIDPNRRGGRPVNRTTVRYELVMVARIPATVGPPALLEVDAVRWQGLNWSSTLSKPQALTARVKESSLPEAVAQRLRGPDRLATEFKLLRDGQIVFAGPLRTWRKQGDAVEIAADGLAAYLQGMIVTSDLRYDQVDQHAIVKDLVDRWQNGYAYCHAGIDTSDVAASGKLRDGSYAYKEIHVVARRIEELGARADGFDHEVDPTTRKLQCWYPGKGIDRSQGADAVIFDDRNVDSLDVMCSVAPDDMATYAFGAGSSSATDGTLWSAYYDPAAAAAYGGFALAQSWSDVSEQTTLDDHTLALLRAHQQALFVPGPKARVTADADLMSYDVGDTVGFESSGVLAVRGAYRIRKRAIQVQEDGTEAVDLEFV
jgi:hypothetical protein